MHLIYENIAGYAMFQHWIRKFFKKDNQNNDEYILSKTTWNEVIDNKYTNLFWKMTLQYSIIIMDIKLRSWLLG